MYYNRRRLVLGGLLATMLLAITSPLANAQQPGSTGRTATDFSDSLRIDGFDSANGELVAADITLTADLDSRVLELTNNSGSAADFTVTALVRFCGRLGGSPDSYAACVAPGAAPSLVFETAILSESFVSLPAGATISSSESATASDLASMRVLDPASLAQFVDSGGLDFGIATLTSFQALGGGGNSLVELETFAVVAVGVSYVFAGVSIDKQTNGGDGVVLRQGDAVLWTYDVTNIGNTALQNVVVSDDREGEVCVLPLIEASETLRCTAAGIVGASAYENLATVVGEPVINPVMTVADEDPSGYLVEPSPTAVPPTPAPAPTTPSSALTEPRIDIELATNEQDADLAPGVRLDLGQAITWSYVVTNTGDVDLYDVTVSDDIAGGVCRAVAIPVGAQTSCTLQGTAALGAFRRVADVQGESISGQHVTDTDPTHHVVTDEVLGVVVTPSPPGDAPGLGVIPPDEVLAYTGADADRRAATGVGVVALGCALMAVSTRMRRSKATLRAS